MPMGGGKYEKALAIAARRAHATSAVLIILDGKRGPGFSIQATLEQLAALPEILEEVAQQIRADRANVPRNA